MPQESILVDLQNETCALQHAPELQTLQTIMTFPRNNATKHISVDVIAKDVDDCSSPAWTWFVGSSSNRFRECYNVNINKIGVFSLCRMACVCPDSASCQFLNFKYAFDQTSINITNATCKVKHIDGDIRVPYYGNDWTDSQGCARNCINRRICCQQISSRNICSSLSLIWGHSGWFWIHVKSFEELNQQQLHLAK